MLKYSPQYLFYIGCGRFFLNFFGIMFLYEQSNKRKRCCLETWVWVAFVNNSHKCFKVENKTGLCERGGRERERFEPWRASPASVSERRDGLFKEQLLWSLEEQKELGNPLLQLPCMFIYYSSVFGSVLIYVFILCLKVGCKLLIAH